MNPHCISHSRSLVSQRRICMESLPKACLQHPGYRQINYEAPNLLKKNPNPLPANSNEPLSLSFPSAYHLKHTIMPPLGTCTHSLTVFFSFLANITALSSAVPAAYMPQPAFFNHLRPLCCRNAQNCPLPPSRKQMSNIVLQTPTT